MQIEIYDKDHQSLPFVKGSDEPCCDANPSLWSVFCVFTGRDSMSVSPYWTEQDVVNFLVVKGVEYRDAKSASHRS